MLTLCSSGRGLAKTPLASHTIGICWNSSTFVRRHLRRLFLSRARNDHSRASVLSVDEFCVACKTQKHPLYMCHHFRSLPHEHKTLLVKNHKMCFNCLKPGHFVSQCPSNQRCKKCQRRHYSLLHAEPKSGDGDDKVPPHNNTPMHISHVARTDTSQKHILLMTCRVLVVTPDGLTTQARALLDSASSTSFVSERLVQRLRLPRLSQLAHIAGIGGVSHRALSQSVVHFAVTHTAAQGKTFDIQAIVLPRVTSELPRCPVTFNRQWTYLSGLQLADPDFGIPRYVDILLGMDVFSSVLLHGRRTGAPGTPSAFQTCFGWVLGGAVSDGGPEEHVVSYHTSHWGRPAFWEIEDRNPRQSLLSLDEEPAVNHFATSCSHDESGRFMVPLPKKPHTKSLGESRSQAVRRFLSLERSLHGKGHFQEFAEVIDEYLEIPC